ncbi:putative galacturonosyltransferase 15 [Citrus sinensis]|nr:putative galacturonosyltransferase 15 [Citrus sinensis]
MKFYISTTGIKRVTISNSGTGKRSSAPAAALAGRRIPSSRTLLPVVLVLGIVLPFLFVRVAFLVLESSAVCSSSLVGGPFVNSKLLIFDGVVSLVGEGYLTDSVSYHKSTRFGELTAVKYLTLMILAVYVFSFTVLACTMKKLREELTRALIEAKDGSGNGGGGIQGTLDSFNELVKEVTSKRQDIKAFAFKTKAMGFFRLNLFACSEVNAFWFDGNYLAADVSTLHDLLDDLNFVMNRFRAFFPIKQLLKMEHEVQSSRQRESIYWHLASHGVPKSLHCLCLKLAEEYAVNAMARSRLPSPEYVSHLTDPSFHHVVLLTDNVLAASVVVSSTVQNSARPEKLVFHIVTDKKTYTPMHSWFAINSFRPAVVEVKGLHQYDWPQEVNVGVKEMLEAHRLIWSHYYKNLKHEDFEYEGENRRCLEVLSPSCLSLMNHLRIYIPELFPDLNKILFLDDDVVVQHDLSSLLELDLNGKVVGAVVGSLCGDNCCPGRKYKDYLNFSYPIISSNFDHDHCAWLYGMNVLDLEAWRRTNITATYHKWLKLNLKSGLELWQPGALPPALLALDGNVHPIDPSWHVAELGQRSLEAHEETLKSAAVLHFSGPAKPWLEIGLPEVREETYSVRPEGRRFGFSLCSCFIAQFDISYSHVQLFIIENR